MIIRCKLLVKPFGPRYLVTKPMFEDRDGQDRRMERKTMTREIGAVHTRTAAAEQKKGGLTRKRHPDESQFFLFKSKMSPH